MSFTVNYPACLHNSRDLELGPIQLRYLDISAPTLLTIFELERPVILAHRQLSQIIQELQLGTNGEFALKGLFTLGIAQFETMLSDLLINILQFFPQKIALLKNLQPEEQSVNLSQEQLLGGEAIRRNIELQVNRLSYGSLDKFLRVFIEVFSIEKDHFISSQQMDELIEIKETRNLLLHNNLIVNEFYLRKTRSIKRSNVLGSRLDFNSHYVAKSLEMMIFLTEILVKELRAKYGHYTVLPLLKRLWGFNFKSPIIIMDEFCTLNEEGDIYDGPFKFPEGRSSSEHFFLEFWQAQRHSNPITRPSLVHLGSSIRKLAFLTEVFGELRFPHWHY